MKRAKKKRRSLKSAIALLLAGVMLVGQTHGIGAAGASTVQAAETTTITSLSYYDDANSEFSKSGTGAKYADVGFVMPLFNGKSCSELALPAVQDDLTLYVKQANRTNGEWVDIDELVDYFQFNVTWGWEEQDWGGKPGWICWFRIDETTELKFQSNTNSDVYLTYTLTFNKLATLELTSLASKGDLTASATGSSGISKVASFIFNGDASIQYSQIEDDFNDDNTEILVKRDSETEFVPLFNNPDADWIYDQNFGVYTNDGGGWWFANLEESITVRFTSTENKFADVDIRIIYNAPARDNYILSATNGTEFNAVRDDHSAVIGLCLPRIGGTDVRQSDLEKFVYQIKDNGEWKNLGDVWLYRENGYSNLTDETQWGYSVNDLYELWFKPIKEDAELRIGYPLNGERGGDIGDNYIYYTFIGDPDAVIPDVSDMGNITIDNTHTDGDVTNVTAPEGWNMIWNDEFNGTSLNEANWSNQTGYLLDPNDIGTYGWGNKELEHYTDSPNNTSVANGKLNLTLLKEPKTFYEADDPSQSVTAEYSSGKVISQNKFAVKYGRVDIRAKLPDGNGIWPALWMMPNKDTYGTWARSGELDIMEGRGRLPDIAYGTLHYGDLWPGDKEDGLKMTMSEHGLTNFTDWHVYSVVWEEDNIKIYCDGICYYKGTNEIWYSSGAPDNPNAPFDQQFYLIFNLAAGGYFDGLIEPDDDVTRKDMYVDYVRVYQREATEGEPDDDGDGLYGDYLLAVKVPLEKMTLDKTSVSIPAGVSEVITPSFEPSNATNKNVIWTSSNEAVATVSGGIVKGIAPGTATITAVAEDGNITKTCEVTVTGDEVVMIVVDPETLELEAGQKSKLTATVSTELSNQNVTWSSSNTSVATVDQNGYVTAVAEGTATITAQTEGGTIYSDTCEVTVTPEPPVSVTGVTIKNGTDESGEVSIEAGSSVTLSATVVPSDATNKNVTWTTGDDSIATVSNGKVTAVKEGTTTVTVKTEDGNYIDTWNVIVTKKSAERTDYGVVRNGNDITFYYKGSAGAAFSTMLDSADQTIDQTQVPGYGVVQNGDYYEYTIVDGAVGNEDKYLAYWFDTTYMDKKIIKVSDIPVADDGSETTVAVTGVTLNNTTLTMVKDETVTLRATVEPLTATNRNVTWKSSDDSIVSVDGGKLTALKAGTATITVTTEDGSYAATCTVTVGNSYTVQFKDGDTVLDTQIVQENGTVTAPSDPEKTGHTFVGWVYNNATYNFSSPVTSDMVIEADWDQIMVTRIQMSNTITLEAGKTTTITPTVTPTDAFDRTVTWSSDNKAVATVDENTGVITAVAVGTATITATAKDGSNVTASCEVTVTEPTIEKASYQVDFIVDGNSIKSVRVEEGSAIAAADIPADPTKTGYTFDGWYEGDTKFDLSSAITKTTQLVAKFTKDNVAVTGVTLNTSAITLQEGATQTLSATIAPSDATDKSVTWSSDNDAVATVENGVVTAVSTGTATITVTTTDGSHTATCAVTVTEATEGPVAVTSVVLDKETVSIVEGETAELAATVNPSNATDTSISWSTSNPAVATVENGVVTAVSAGTATITVTTTDGAHTADCEVTVTAKAPATVAVTGVSLNKSSVSLQKGASETLVPTISPATATDTSVSWSSSDPTVVTVVNGVVTAVRKGTATITVTTNDGAYTATCAVTVTDTQDIPTNIPVTDIVISDASKTIKVGESVTLTATAYPETATNREITWSTLDSSVATVDPSTGLVTGVSVGTTDIYAIAVDGSGVKEVCAVTVQADSSTPSTPDTPSNPETKTYTVVFDSTGGSTVASQVVTEGGVVTQPAVPTRAGYTFVGWYNGSAQYVFGTAVTGNLTLTAAWTVNKVNSIKITGISKKIAVNRKIQLTATVNEDALDKSVTWSVDKSKYATVSQSGVVKMKKAGKGKYVTVTATANDGSGVKATYKIKIMHYAVKKITLVGSKSVKAGKKVKLKAIVNPVTVSKKKINKTLQWTSSNEEWATVTKKGVVKTTKAGKGKTVKITAKATDGSNRKKTISIRIK